MIKKPLLFLILIILISALGFSLSFVITKSTALNNQLSKNTATAKIKGESTGSSGLNAIPTQNRKDTLLVTRVIDGDTIEIESGQRIRYIGIDTPETVDPNQKTHCFGPEASAKNKELVEGKQIRLEKDVSETDKYGRLLRYIYVGDTFVNELLVSEGFASASSYPPDIKYQQQLNQAQTEARVNNRGLWAHCASGSQNNQTVENGCNIKGNISSAGNKIYHLPGQRYYDKTAIDEAKGEKWFCTEEDALKAGYRKSKV